MTLLDETMGMLFIGVLIAGILYGVSCTQVYFYFSRYSRDPMYMKLLVLGVWVSDTIHQALISHSLYWYLVTNYGQPATLALLAPTIIIEVVIQAVTGLLVQCFFAARVYRLSGQNWYLTVPVGLLIAVEFAVSTAYTARALKFASFAELTEVKALSISINAFAAAGDVCIAIILCTILQTSKTGFQRSTRLINKLMIFSLNTGLLTSICACLSLITILALPDTFVYIVFFFIIGRLYSNSFMATLNARKGLHDGSSSGDASLSLQNMHPTANSANISRQNGTHIAIQIDTTKDSQRDHELEESESAYKGNTKRHMV
ncbi:uncharacterized protein BXZ73DRAFT_101417 [Epithele typhae]|uniref:uncharacterized protein n=1 Tax=Epithele typhae TaxID=378194 RepID=UPI002007BE59|nr:uncharacterized protein BXZ73DRAFT_101417 [Epithele typhae]KAH9932042.1 hypothetical protein BXZ73DRAFT_101417 [Epithele typhae]